MSKTPGQIAYEAYYQHLHEQEPAPFPAPLWKNEKHTEQEAWEAAADAVIDLARQEVTDEDGVFDPFKPFKDIFNKQETP